MRYVRDKRVRIFLDSVNKCLTAWTFDRRKTPCNKWPSSRTSDTENARSIRSRQYLIYISKANNSHSIIFWPLHESPVHCLGVVRVKPVSKKQDKYLFVVSVLHRILFERLIGYTLQIVHQRLQLWQNISISINSHNLKIQKYNKNHSLATVLANSLDIPVQNSLQSPIF